MYRTRNTDVNPAYFRTGMWVWVIHRVTGVIIVLYAIAHLAVISNARQGAGAGFDRVTDSLDKPYIHALELVLIATILFHALNGLRLVVFDFGVGVKIQKQLFWSLMAVWAVLMVFITRAFWPLMTG